MNHKLCLSDFGFKGKVKLVEENSDDGPFLYATKMFFNKNGLCTTVIRLERTAGPRGIIKNTYEIGMINKFDEQGFLQERYLVSIDDGRLINYRKSSYNDYVNIYEGASDYEIQPMSFIKRDIQEGLINKKSWNANFEIEPDEENIISKISNIKCDCNKQVIYFNQLGEVTGKSNYNRLGIPCSDDGLDYDFLNHLKYFEEFYLDENGNRTLNFSLDPTLFRDLCKTEKLCSDYPGMTDDCEFDKAGNWISKKIVRKI